MVRNKVVLGDNKIINLQNAVYSTMNSLRRNMCFASNTTLATDNCISCKAPRPDVFGTSNILRCSALQDGFAWVCTTCLTTGEANLDTSSDTSSDTA